MHPLWRAARGGVGRWRDGSLPLAPCLYQPAHRRGASRARTQPGVLLPRRTAERGRVCSRKAGKGGAACADVAHFASIRRHSGGGAAANAAAETLRNEGYRGGITMLSADDSVPYDRPNLSKGFLAGSAEEDWIPLRSPDFYKKHNIDLKLATRVAALDPSSRKLQLADGSELMYDALLLATGAGTL